jgi:imidazolonepropionase-like amidohydrolase
VDTYPNSKPRTAAGLAAAVLLLHTVAVAAADPPLVIKGGSLFDPASGTMTPIQAVVIDGAKVRAVGTPRQPAPVPAGARVIDAAGKFIVPGLIDAHVHLVHRLNFAHVTGDEVLPLFLAHGVTAVRDAGDEVVAQTVVARYAESHPGMCPRVFTASHLIDADPPIHRDIGLPVSDPSRVPALVEDMAAWKVTTLKIYAGTGRAVGRKVIEEGHRRGLAVTGHLGGYPALEAVEDGIDCIEHITSVFDFVIPPEVRKKPDHRAELDLDNPQARALVAALARQKTPVDPTLVVYRNMLLLSDLKEVQGHPDNASVPGRLRTYWDEYRLKQGLAPATRERRQREFAKYRELTGLLDRAGVPLLAGTDAPEPYCPPGLSLHQELELLVESGLTPAAALRAATLANAKALKKEDALGSVEAGKLADLVILTADPTADIRNTRKVEAVVRGGLVCDPKRVLAAVPTR